MISNNQRGGIAGLLVAISLLLVDYSTLQFGVQGIQIAGYSISLSITLSAAFMSSLIGGYMMGKAYAGSPDSLRVWVFGTTWFGGTIIFALITVPFGIPLMILTPLGLLLGGLGLFIYRVTKKEQKPDFLISFVLMVSTLINIVFFLWEAFT